MHHKVLITTSGIGSRLGEHTSYTNKALVRVGNMPAISHIIESYPKETEFVITLGHFGAHIRDFLTLAYPERNFEFVEVEKYEGPGTSLGRSMLEAKNLLRSPFIYHACDTLVKKEIPLPDKNWIGVYKGSDTAQYASWTIVDGRLQFNEKGATAADFIHIGLIGVNEFELFWDTLESLYKANPNNNTLNDCQTLAKMIEMGSVQDTVEFPIWSDIGNITSLQKARQEEGSSPNDLDKKGEAIFILKDSVIKFFSDENVVKNRAKRGEILAGFVPKMEGIRGNFYMYNFMPGELYSQVVQPEDFKSFLSWSQNNFWKKENIVDPEVFSKACYDFYYNKTNKRVEKFLKENNLSDIAHVINGEHVPPVAELLKQIDFKWLSSGLQSRFHGDFILENILKTEKSFCLIDWRHDFGGLLQSGDRYYDLAKLNHNLTVNHRVINNNQFSVNSDGENVRVEIMRPSQLVECQEEFFRFLHKQSYDYRKVKIITAIIWLNMAPLHHYPFNLFLYYFGKLNLYRAIKS